MTVAIAALVAALLFAAAGYGGIVAAQTLIPRLPKLEDGPEPAETQPAFLLVGAGLLGAVVGWHHVPILQLLVLALVAGALVAIWFTDTRTGLVPDLFSLPPIGLVLLLSLGNRDWWGIFGAALIFVVFAIAAMLSKGRGMGWGDAKLAALGGLLLGPVGGTFFFGVGSLVAVIVTSIRYRSRQMPIAFAPYMVAAIAVGIVATFLGFL